MVEIEWESLGFCALGLGTLMHGFMVTDTICSVGSHLRICGVRSGIAEFTLAHMEHFKSSKSFARYFQESCT